MKTGIITRNSRALVERALHNFPGLAHDDFEVVVTRDDPGRAKPAPDGVILAAERMGIRPSEILVAGDHYVDIRAGREAGAVTVLVRDGHAGDDMNGDAALVPDLGGGEPIEPDFTVSGLGGLEHIVRLGLPLLPGKLPNDLLDRYFRDLPAPSSSVVLPPRVGEDVAAVALGLQAGGTQDSALVVLKSDPITFTADRLAEYLVSINANDVITSGAEPRWLLNTVLAPPGTTPSEALSLLGDLAAVCARQGIDLCGGHTEITDAVTRPVVVGSMVGTVPATVSSTSGRWPRATTFFSSSRRESRAPPSLPRSWETS